MTNDKPYVTGLTSTLLMFSCVEHSYQRRYVLGVEATIQRTVIVHGNTRSDVVFRTDEGVLSKTRDPLCFRLSEKREEKLSVSLPDNE